MEIEILRHDGPTRLGILHAGHCSVNTPACCYFSEESEGMRIFEIGSGTGLSISIPPISQLLRPGRVGDSTAEQGLVIRTVRGDEGSNAVELVSEPEKIVSDNRLGLLRGGSGVDLIGQLRLVVEMRKKMHPNAALIVSDADVWSFPLFALVGADLFMDSHARPAALAGEMIFESYSVTPEGRADAACNCPHCCTGVGRDLLAHNRWITEKVISEVRNRARIGQMKHMAEEMSLSHPSSLSALKVLYRDYLEFMEEYSTIVPGVGT